jgi:predicted acetyltransferase
MESYLRPGLELREASETDKADSRVYAMLQLIGAMENGFGNAAYGIACEDYPAFIETLIRQRDAPDLASGFVPQASFWLFDGDEAIGYAKLRYFLTDRLCERGGHIGYGIRSDRRGQGYASAMLALCLRRAEALGIGEALITCDEANIASRRVIEKNGGRLISLPGEHCRYAVTTGPREAAALDA